MEVRHFVEGDVFDLAVTGGLKRLDVVGFHVVLPELSEFPLLIEEEVVGISVIFVEVVLKATFFLQGGCDQVPESGQDFFAVFRIDSNVGDDSKFWHSEG